MLQYRQEAILNKGQLIDSIPIGWELSRETNPQECVSLWTLTIVLPIKEGKSKDMNRIVLLQFLFHEVKTRLEVLSI